MAIQTTAITTLLGLLVMLGAYLYVGQRIHESKTPVLRPVRLLHQFFLSMVVFFILMSLPDLWLTFDPSKFPLYMAWGYSIGHIFLYTAFIAVGRMLFSIVPKLASKEKLLTVVLGVVTVVITVVNVITMVWGTQPAYNAERSLIQYNAAPVVGATIGLMAAITVLPAAILFLINAFQNKARRVRSLLLGSGFAVMVVGGPLHDVARSWQMYLAADILAIICIVLVGAGVVYRFEESISLERSQSAPVKTPSSSSV
ncbi:MAG TPA: hypothetical protein VHQ86_04440 [Candidatus Saccharimonadia bacterium]|nr:hypothetical protein [Candidatus Saccharimonadia bacterium]